MKSVFARMTALAVLCVLSSATVASASTIAEWTFNNYTAPAGVWVSGTNSAYPNAVNNPAPTTDNTSGSTSTASCIGFNLPLSVTFNGGEGPGSINWADVQPSSGTLAYPTNNLWRVRGPSNVSGGGNYISNGWNSAAPQYSQGAEFSVDTTGYSNLSATFGWFSTTQGAADLMPRYSINGGSTWTNLLSTPLEMNPSDVNVGADSFTVPLPSNAANQPGFEMELVSAYNPQLGTYASATSVAKGTPSGLNNSSGNWRFNEFEITGTPSAVPEPSTLALFGVALIGLLGYARRKRMA